jgi:hypothetical protein
MSEQKITADELIALVDDYAGWSKSLGAWKLGNPESGLTYEQTKRNRDQARDKAHAALLTATTGADEGSGGGFRAARGISPRNPNDPETPEQQIRRMRDTE